MSIDQSNHTLYGVATVGPKGQIVIPVDARKRLGVEPGDKIVIVGPAHKPQFVGLCNEKAFNDIVEKIDTQISHIKSKMQNQKAK
ncbi:AbrB/MazE/SpoVT family DNA-binding domain-containing protein [Candidatus Saccharibacteria bacterium]|nr:AbrB/MazE/SpoVT family DNA-binding domain-containing protein [Candidatus Saccharibacteria bacterium]